MKPIKIYLDSGHNFSGGDTGAEGNGIREQDITYQIAKKVGALLVKLGVQIRYSRDMLTTNKGTTEDESIKIRYTEANNWNADYFISLHTDASEHLSAKGSHICIYKKGGEAEKLAKAIIPKLISIGFEGRSTLIDERPDLGVLRKTNMPAILIEMGFITNPDNATRLTYNQDEIAKSIFDGVCEYLDIKKEELTEINDIVWELANRGIITDKGLWLNKLKTDQNSYWLARKCVNYIRGIGG